MSITALMFGASLGRQMFNDATTEQNEIMMKINSLKDLSAALGVEEQRIDIQLGRAENRIQILQSLIVQEPDQGKKAKLAGLLQQAKSFTISVAPSLKLKNAMKRRALDKEEGQLQLEMTRLNAEIQIAQEMVSKNDQRIGQRVKMIFGA